MALVRKRRCLDLQPQPPPPPSSPPPAMDPSPAVPGAIPPPSFLKSSQHPPPVVAVVADEVPVQPPPRISLPLSTPSAQHSTARPHTEPSPHPAGGRMRFDTPFTVLDDDITLSPEDAVRSTAPPSAAAAAAAGARRGGAKMTARKRASAGGAAPPTSQAMSDAVAAFTHELSTPLRTRPVTAPASATSASMVPSSVPVSPDSPSSSVPTAVTSPVASAGATASPPSRLMQELESLAARQKERSPALDNDDRSERASPITTAKTARGAGKAARKAKRKAAPTSPAKRARPSAFVDTNNARDIRGFTQSRSTAASIVGGSPASADVTSSPVQSALWAAAAPQVDIPSLLAHFATREEQKQPAVPAAPAAAVREVKKKGERVRPQQGDGSKQARGKRARATQAPAAPRARHNTRARKAAETPSDPSQPAAPIDVEPRAEDAPLSLDFSPPTPRAAEVPAPSIVSSPPPTVADEMADDVRALERAKTVVATMAITTTDQDGLRTQSLSPRPLSAMLPSASISGNPLRSRLSDEITRQMSLTSTTSSASTASAEPSRLASPDFLRRPHSPAPCEWLAPTFKAYQGQSLSCALSASHTLSCFGVTTAGHVRPLNQDAFSLSSYPSIRPGCEDARVAVFGLFDGHGTLGENASRVCAEFMSDRVAGLFAAQQQRQRRSSQSQSPPVTTSAAFACLSESFDAAQRLLLAVARSEQVAIANVLKKQKPELHVVASPACVSIALHPIAPASPMSLPPPPAPDSPPTPASPRLPPMLSSELELTHDPFSVVPLRRVGARGGCIDGIDNGAAVDEEMKEQNSRPNPCLLISDAETPAEESKDAEESPSAAGKGTALVPPPPAVERRKRRRKAALFRPRKRNSPSPPSPATSIDSSSPEPPPVSSASMDTAPLTSASTDIMPPSLSSSLLPIKRSPIKPALPPRLSTLSPRVQHGHLPVHDASALSPFIAKPHTVAVDVDYGTTGLVLVVDGADLFFANCGDSRAIVYQWREPPSPDDDPHPPTRQPTNDPRPASPALSLVRPSASSHVVRSFSSPLSSCVSGLSNAAVSTSLSPSWRHVYATSDHDPSLPNASSQGETSRILAAHGLIHSLPGQHRIYPANISLQEARARALTLNMSRALGHNLLSQHGVDHTPELGHARLTDERAEEGDGWVVMGSDGLWDMLCAAEVLAVVEKEVRAQRARQRPCKGDSDSDRNGGLCLECICCQLLTSAESQWKVRGGGDNVTVVVARIARTR